MKSEAINSQTFIIARNQMYYYYRQLLAEDKMFHCQFGRSRLRYQIFETNSRECSHSYDTHISRLFRVSKSQPSSLYSLYVNLRASSLFIRADLFQARTASALSKDYSPNCVTLKPKQTHMIYILSSLA